MTSNRLTVTMTELDSVWSFVDCLDAHLVLDLLDDLEMKARDAST